MKGGSGMKMKAVIASVIGALLLGVGLLSSLNSGLCGEPDVPNPEIAADQAVWGAAYAGFTLSVRTPKDSYRLGEAVSLPVSVQNVSNGNSNVLSPGNIPYRIALYDEKGYPVQSTQLLRESASKFYDDGFDYFEAYRQMAKGQIIDDQPIDLTKLFNIRTAGNYHVVVMRRIDPKLSRGFLVSNMGVITVEEKP